MCTQRVLTNQYSIYLILSTVFHVINLTCAIMKSYLYYLIDLILSNLVSSLYLFNQIIHHLSIYIYLPTHRSVHLFIGNPPSVKKQALFACRSRRHFTGQASKYHGASNSSKEQPFFAPVDGGAADTFGENL